MTRRELWLAAGMCALLVLFMARAAHAVYIPFGSPVDVDKSHQAGNWTDNWFGDIITVNGNWDFTPDQPNPPFTEPYGDANIWGQSGVFKHDQSCWLATASNMLSAAGYGDGNNIYQSMIDHFGWVAQGNIDTALAWYLTQVPNNEYNVITVYNNDGFGMIGALTVQDFLSAEIRTPDFIGIAMTPQGPGFDHAVTVWGDDLAPGWTPGGGSSTQLYITDSDMDIAGDYPLYDDVDWYGWFNPQVLNYGAAGYRIQSVVTLGAVPEPATLAMVGLGLLCLAGCLRRKRKV